MLVATKQITAEIYECDGCGKETIVEKNGELPHGFHMDTTHIGDFGGVGGEVYACTERCIRKAVLSAGAAKPPRATPAPTGSGVNR